MPERKKRRWISKLIISLVLFVAIIGSSIAVAFADEDISSLFTNWFQSKTESMKEEVSEEINAERDRQAERLEEELTVIIDSAENDLKEFTASEKEKSIEQIKAYADEILNNFAVDDEEDKENLIQGFEEILQNAKDEMDELTKEQSSENNNYDE